MGSYSGDNLPERYAKGAVAKRVSEIEGIREQAMDTMDKLADAYVAANEQPKQPAKRITSHSNSRAKSFRQ